MFKTSIQLVLLLTLILIIFFISQKYFYTEDSINESNNTITLNKSGNNFSNKNSKKSNNDNEIINLTFEKFDTNGNMYLIKAKKGILAGQYNINMSKVEASLIYTNNEKLTIYSNEAVFHKETFKTIFSNGVKLIYQEQKLESDSLEFLFDKNIAIFKDNVKYYNQNIEAFADIVNINLLTKEIDIKSKKKKKTRMSIKN